MRFLLILLCLAGLAGTALHAVTMGTGVDRFAGAPQIEARVDARMTEVVTPLAPRPLDVSTDGRNVRLRGAVETDAERQAILAAARDVPLLGRLTDDLTVLPTAAPFTFTAEKTADGSLALTGHVPDRATEDALLAQARTIAGTGTVSADLTIAAGAPKGDWANVAKSGLDALGLLNVGTLALSDETVLLNGESPDPGTTEMVAGLADTAPSGDWTLDIAGAAPPGGFAFTATRADDGTVALTGHAPDEATRQAWAQLAADTTGAQVSNMLELASGMPEQGFPERVAQALQALAITRTGTIAVSEGGTALQGQVDADSDNAAVMALVDDTWRVDLEVLNPTPEGNVTLTLDDDGRVAVTGMLPEGVAAEGFYQLAPGIDLSGLDRSQTGKAADWTPALKGLEIVLPRFERAQVGLHGQRLSVAGTLRRGFSASGSEAALKTVLDRDWKLDLALIEAAPLAEVMLSKRGQDISLSGVLPNGMTPQEALTLMGNSAGGDGLTSGGDGDPDAWKAGLKGLGQGIGLFRDLTAQVSNGAVEIDGTLDSGYSANDTQEWLSARMGDAWNVGLTAEETRPGEGDRRVSLETGETENFRRGYWLPDVDFPVSSERCKQEIDGVLTQQQIQFVTGSAEIDRSGRALLNRLAAVAVRCLNSSVLTLEIQGHTDSRGDEAINQRLSEARATAVVDAMIDRGVRADAMTAKGFGESRPIATNNTSEGRAQNRRIDFSWSETEG